MGLTTQREIYEGILVDLKAGVSSVHNDYIYVTPMPLFSPADSVYIQLIPGVPTIQTDITGLGLIEETFKVAVWARVFLDVSGQSTERITDSTYGVMSVMGEVRQALIHDNANGEATIPIRWISGSNAVESNDAPGWVYYEDTYQIGYEITWS
ncbi:MAG: hypothetical protein Unbinned97contig1000_9 [Prokaryotic dsDNA virus sp.]|nr:MAG: hypothetical protein Unbinned97contig1000_9 [Prokaryotic dsDNA virus sp.]|tara:strand:- start:362 stop:820 length:459 start_codon:yes stop_codon:yes gene_type:complete